MFIPQTIEEYLDNPMGRGSSVISERKAVKELLLKKYDKLIEKHKRFKYTIYSTKMRNVYIHFTIPSESDRGNDYDVVIYFTFGNDPLGLQNDMKKANIKIFCNAPSFIYTYAYVFNQNGMGINSLKKRLAPETFELPPEHTNPYKIISWEKHVFFALTYMMKNRHLLNRVSCIAQSKRFNEREFPKIIRTQDQIMFEIDKFNKLAKKKKEDEARKLKEERALILRVKAKRNADKNIKTGVSHIKPKSKIGPSKSTRKK